jgi:hypothetical protein
VLDRRHRQRIVLASAAGSRDLLADALVYDLEVRVVQERLEVRAREPLRGICEVIKVDVVRYGDLPRMRLYNLHHKGEEGSEGEKR